MSDLRAAPVETDANPMPPGGEVIWLTVAGRAPMRTMIWRPENAGIETCRGTVLLLNGRTEFIEKYFEVIGELIARGFAVASLDWRGQGLSYRPLGDRYCGHIDDFAAFDRDLGVFLEQIVKPSLPSPFIGLAHSMGGNLLMRLLGREPGLLRGAAFSAPMLGIRFPNALARLGASLLAHAAVRMGKAQSYVPGGGPDMMEGSTFAENIVTHDERRFLRTMDILEAEPNLKLGSPSYGWLKAAMASCREVTKPAYLAEISVPVMIAVAEEDVLVDNAAVKRAAELLPDCRLVEIAGARHEILMEKDAARARFWDAFDKLTEEVL